MSMKEFLEGEVEVEFDDKGDNTKLANEGLSKPQLEISEKATRLEAILKDVIDEFGGGFGDRLGQRLRKLRDGIQFIDQQLVEISKDNREQVESLEKVIGNLNDIVKEKPSLGNDVRYIKDKINLVIESLGERV